jgi:Mrp family chromosome partitioning ATPase
VPPPPDSDTIQRQYDATQNEYYTKFSQRQTLITQGPPQSQLSQLERASGIPISKGEYESRLSLGASGQNNLRVETSNGEPVIDVSSGSSSAVSGPLARTLLGLLLGLLAGIGLALLLDRLDHRIRSRSEAEEAFQLPVLAEVPTFSRTQQKQQVIVATDAPRSRAAEAYRAIRTSLLFQQASIQASDPAVPALNGHSNGAGNGQANGTSADVAEPFEHLDDLFEDQPAQRLALMVTSASPREGKTNTTANLAVVFAEAGASVLVVNCDFRRPSVHKLFGLEDIPRTVQSTSVPGVKLVTNVLTDPNANPAQVIAAQRQVIAAARDRFDVIILDTAPILTANDAVEVVGSADLVLLVARANVTTADGAERSVDVLSRLGAPMGGVVLVASGESSSQYYYYYQQGQSGSRRRVGRKSEPDDAPAPLGS